MRRRVTIPASACVLGGLGVAWHADARPRKVEDIAATLRVVSLTVWGERAGCIVSAHEPGVDPVGVIRRDAVARVRDDQAQLLPA